MSKAIIEQVAKAICEEATGDITFWKNYINHATKAIKALREPDDKMLASANALPITESVDSCIGIAAIHGCPLPTDPQGTALQQWYRAMIDSAMDAS